MEIVVLYAGSVILGFASLGLKVSQIDNLLLSHDLKFKDWKANLNCFGTDIIGAFLPIYNLVTFAEVSYKHSKYDNTDAIEAVQYEMKKGNVISINDLNNEKENTNIEENENWFEECEKEQSKEQTKEEVKEIVYKKSYEQIEFEKLSTKEKIERLREEIQKLKNEEKKEKKEEYINVLELDENLK